MILDSSALIAVLRREPEWRTFLRQIDGAPQCHLSAANYVETAAVVDSLRDPVASRELDDFIRESAIAIQPVTITQAYIARQAYRDFGKGSGHPARLNFGDCFAYALAKELAEPLLFKGEDFSHTDVTPATDIR
jgi:ribonuclease VapC